MNSIKWEFRPALEFGEFSDTWKNLNDAHSKSILLEPIFVELCLKHFGRGHEMLAIATINSKAVAIGVILKKNILTWETFQPSQAPVGFWLTNGKTNIKDIFSSLLSQLQGFPLLFGITQQDPTLNERPTCTNNIRTLDYIETASITVQGSFNEYWADRGRNLRQNLKKQRNKLKKSGIATQLGLIDNPELVKPAIKDYGHLESMGWKNNEGTAVNINNSQGKFYQALLEHFCKLNQGYIYNYKFNNEIVAIDLCIGDKDNLIILKTTYNEKYKNFSPALLMREETFCEIFDNTKFKKIEFYGRVMEWHKRWTNETRTMYHAEYSRWKAMGLIR